MPKYELVTQTMHRRVLNALFLLDSDRMRQESDDDDDGEDEEDNVGNNVPDRNDEDTERPPATDNHPAVNALTVVPPPCTPATARGFVLTPRPSIGKKRAKVLAQQAAAIKLKKKEPAAADVPSVNQLLKHRQNESLERLALASEAKANVAKEQYMFNFHMKFPTSAASIAWFAAKQLEYAPAALPVLVLPPVAAPLPNVVNVDEPAAHDDSDHEDPAENSDDDDNGSHTLDTHGPPGIDTSTIEDINEESQWETLPPTQRLVSSFNDAIVEDSQMTTLME